MSRPTGTSCPPASPPNTVFLDSLTFPSAFAVLRTLGWRSFSDSKILFFAEGHRGVRVALGFLSSLGLLRHPAEQHNYFLGHLRESDGEAIFPRILADEAAQVCREVELADIQRNLFLRDVGYLLCWDRLRVYYLKKIYQATVSPVIQINIAERWKNNGDGGSSVWLFLARDRWSGCLVEHAHGKGVVLVTYPSLGLSVHWRELRYVGGGLLKAFRTLISAILALPEGGFSRRKGGDSPAKDTGHDPSPKQVVAVHCRDLDFDRGTRSDLIWWSPTLTPPSQLLVYFLRPDKRLTREKAALLISKGVPFTALGSAAAGFPDAPVWNPGGTYGRVYFALSAKIAWAFLRTFPRWGWSSFRYLCDLFPLLHAYAFWFDFYHTHGILVDVNYEEFSSPDYIGAQMALRDLGGVSVAYQCSNMSSLYAPLAIMPSADLLFCFSPGYQHLWAHLRPPVRQFVSIGYLFDAVFQRSRKDAQYWRSKFADCVDFVICFFDENPQERNATNGNNGIVSTEEFVEEYRLLLERLRADETLGLLCKPKSPHLLRDRLSRIGALVNEMEHRGRLVFAGLDNSISTTLPAQVGRAADVVIGGLIGTTAALEAHLAGVPAVLIDTIGLHTHPYYCWGRDKVVFASWEKFFCALEAYRRDRNSLPGFGDWSPAIDSIDPFRDGEASGRMGNYIAVLHDLLKASDTPDTALAKSSERYRRRWGAGFVQPQSDQVGSG